jgi:hypothetical protein
VITYSELESTGTKVTIACFQELLKILPEKNRKPMEEESVKVSKSKDIPVTGHGGP